MTVIARRDLLAGAASLAGGGAAFGSPPTAMYALTDEPSRGQLFARVKAAALAEDPASGPDAERFFNLYGPFRFPNDAVYDVVERKAREGSIFGVDISHYTNPAYPIDQLRQKQVRFVYIKTSQGLKAYDGKFAAFYARVRQLPAGSEVHAGAYHFLSSSGSGADQAKSFVRLLQKNKAIVDGKLNATDLPPVMDLEWDIATANGPDRWKGRTRSQIMTEASAFLQEVERATGRKPMIYTARAWWRERMGSDDMGPLAAYPRWIADYSKTSRASEKPLNIGASSPTFWQFTDSAHMALGADAGFDANVFKGSEDDFYAATGARRFA